MEGETIIETVEKCTNCGKCGCCPRIEEAVKGAVGETANILEGGGQEIKKKEESIFGYDSKNRNLDILLGLIHQ